MARLVLAGRSWLDPGVEAVATGLCCRRPSHRRWRHHLAERPNHYRAWRQSHYLTRPENWNAMTGPAPQSAGWAASLASDPVCRLPPCSILVRVVAVGRLQYREICPIEPLYESADILYAAKTTMAVTKR